MRGARARAGALADWLEGPEAATALTDVAYTLALRRPHLPARGAILAHDRPQLVDRLRVLAAGESGEGVVAPEEPTRSSPDVVFVFSGYGSQWDEMGAGMLGEPAFETVLDELEPVFRAAGRASPRELLTRARLSEADATSVQPALFAMQIGLAAVWQHYGIRPAAVMGQSMGELAAAVVGGGLPLADAAQVILRRSEVMQRRMFGFGTTAVVELPAREVERRLSAGVDLEIAVYSSTRTTVVAGDGDVVEEFLSSCEADGIATYPVRGGNAAGHSRFADRVVPELTGLLADVKPTPPELRFYSTTLSDPRDTPAFDGAYWAANVRRPVRFQHAVEAALADGLRTFVEVSPHPVAIRSLADTLADSELADPVAWETLRRGEPAGAALLLGLARAHCRGIGVDWERLAPPGRLVDVPTAVWDHGQRQPVTGRVAATAERGHPLLGTHVRLPGTPARHLWQTTLDTARLTWLDDHRLGELLPLLPGTGYCEMARSAACTAFEAKAEDIVLSDVTFHRLLSLAAPVTVTTVLTVSAPGEAEVEISSRDGDTDIVHATARTAVMTRETAGTGAPAPCTVDGPFRDAGECYPRLRDAGLNHGPAFAGLTGVSITPDQTISRVSRPAAAPPDPRMTFHPALLDACLHGVAMALVQDSGRICLPAGIARLSLVGELGDDVTCRARLRIDAQGCTADLDVYDEDGLPVADLRGVRFRFLDEDALPVSTDGLLYTVENEPAPLAEAGPAPSGDWLVYGGDEDDAFRDGLLREMERAGLRPTPLDTAYLPERIPGAAAVRGVVLMGWETGRAHPEAPEAVADAGRRLLPMVRIAAGLDQGPGDAEAPRLYVVTRGACPPTGATSFDPVQAGLIGLTRSLRFERPELRPTLVDLDPEPEPGQLVRELCSRSPDDEVVWRNGVRHVTRLTQLPAGAPAAPGRAPVREGGGYVVTGGTGGLGLATARWLAERGAGCVVLNGRSVPGADAARGIEEIRALGARVVVVLGDIAEPGVADHLMQAVTQTGAVVRGVVHAAGVLDDALVTDLDAERIGRVWSPKAVGAWRLHLATPRDGVDWWVGYSSSAALLGSPGQANYAAANACLDALAHWRRAHGLPAVSVNWGPWAETGGARDATVSGLGKIHPREAFAALEEVFAHERVQAGAVRLGHDHAVVFPETRASSYFARVVAGAARDRADLAGFDRSRLPGMSREAVHRAVTERLTERIRPLLRKQGDSLPLGTPLVRLGLDSLAAVRIKNAIRDDFRLDIPVSRLLEGASVTALADELTAGLTDGAPEPADPAEDRGEQRSRTRRTRMAQHARRRRPQ
ncbi:SDR family NAD(P)-dependent oxidoreductase [Streptomyces sp. 5-10]|uniref:SDR family NAD(P)-dependent oxidoreductase n=1 Tax=Streptomyces sp. 5-10 TaxID=878925 RepID=UPI00168B3609|nr:SDR family NAD(P)-dependent oxidoreductase [Streptomyces sp. 5-10]MBD3007224.1 type I polyketide synthase [Streptomyces sp. 5-10]